MKYLTTFFLIAGLQLFLIQSCTEAAKKGNQISENKKFEVGQVWRYANRPGEDTSTITILKIEKYDSIPDTIIHIRVDGIKLFSPQSPTGYTDGVTHMPYSQKALMNSVTTLIGKKSNIPDFSEGYNMWKEGMDNGEGVGIFTIPMKEIIQNIDDMQKSMKPIN